MPDKTKKLVRARMEKTGETYQTALRHVMAEAPISEPPAAQAPFPRPSVDDADRAIGHSDLAVSNAAHAVMDAIVVTMARDSTPEDEEEVALALDYLGLALREVGAYIVGEEGDDWVYEWDLTPAEAKQAKIEQEKKRREELARSRAGREATEHKEAEKEAERKAERAAQPRRFSLADTTTGEKNHHLLRDGGPRTAGGIAAPLDLHRTSLQSFLPRELTSVRAITRIAGVPPAFPQACHVSLAPGQYEPATMIGIDEDGAIILKYADGTSESGVYGWDEIFVGEAPHAEA